MGVLLFSAVYAALVWLATLSYQGGLSWSIFNLRRPFWSSFWLLLLGGLILLNVYDTAGKANRLILSADAANFRSGLNHCRGITG